MGPTPSRVAVSICIWNASQRSLLMVLALFFSLVSEAAGSETLKRNNTLVYSTYAGIRVASDLWLTAPAECRHLDVRFQGCSNLDLVQRLVEGKCTALVYSGFLSGADRLKLNLQGISARSPSMRSDVTLS